MTDRNPSPPPESSDAFERLRGDKIGDTVFSQHWLFQTLLKVLQHVEKEEDDHDIPNSEMNSDGDVFMEVEELPKDLEDDMCTLWDMSADTDVAHFLVEFKSRELLLGIIDKTTSPRLLEIVVGIMGNMAFYPDICSYFTEKEGLIEAVLQLLGTTDTPTLIQIIRLLHVCIVNPNCGTLWTNAIKSNINHLDRLKYVLGNSLNGDLLKSTLQLLYHLLERHEGFSNLISTESMIVALTVSANQFVSLQDTESIIEYWHVLHVISRSDGALEYIRNQEALIGQHLRFYIGQFLQNEDPIPPIHHITSVTAAFATFNTLSSAENPDIGTVALLKDASIMRYVKELHVCLQGKLSVQTEGDSPDPSTWEMLFDTLTDTVDLSLQLTVGNGERQR